MDAVVEAECNAVAFQSELDNYTFRDDKILPNDFGYTKSTKVNEILCTCTNKPMLKRILPTSKNGSKVIAYAPCPRVLFTAFMRQLRERPPESSIIPEVVINYHKHCDYLFNEWYLPILNKFEYNVEAWVNHLSTRNKQEEIMPYYQLYKQGVKWGDNWENTNYTMFPKREKQIVENGKYPKCRAISACPANLKWIMGPVVIALEHMCHGKIPGYKISTHDHRPAKDWTAIELELDYRYNELHLETLLDSDYSAWDSTIHYDLKYLINKIYNWLADNGKIHHVDPQLFRTVATARYRKLTATTYIDGRSRIVFSALVDSTVFSGSVDTTWGNSTINLSIGSYTFDTCGVPTDAYRQDATGDDYQAMIPTTYDTTGFRQTWEKTTRALGLVTKYCNMGTYEKSTYCSTNTIQYLDDTGYMRHKLVRVANRLQPLAHYSIDAMHYSVGELKYYYQQLAKSQRFWAHTMPYYGDYAQAYENMAAQLNVSVVQPKNGRPKLTLPTEVVYQSSDWEILKNDMRVSNRQVPDEHVYRFLSENYHYSDTMIALNKHNITHWHNYTPLETGDFHS